MSNMSKYYELKGDYYWAGVVRNKKFQMKALL